MELPRNKIRRALCALVLGLLPLGPGAFAQTTAAAFPSRAVKTCPQRPFYNWLSPAHPVAAQGAGPAWRLAHNL